MRRRPRYVAPMNPRVRLPAPREPMRTMEALLEKSREVEQKAVVSMLLSEIVVRSCAI